MPTMPALTQHVGFIDTIRIERDKYEIHLTSGNNSLVFTATHEQAKQALELESESVRILAVDVNGNKRLLRIEPSSKPEYQPTPEEVESLVFTKWDRLLERLAR